MKYCIILLFSLAILGCRSPETRQYYQILRALNEYDIPRSIDTVDFMKQLNSRKRLDTVLNDVLISRYRDGSEDYICRFRHKDSLIWNIYEYDSADGRLKTWTKLFINNVVENLDYKVYYKNGKVWTFDSYWASASGYSTIMKRPKFTIYQIIDILKSEDANRFTNMEASDMFLDVEVLYSSLDSDSADFDPIIKLDWQVRVNRYDENGRYGAYYRYFDNETGEVLKEWWRYDWGTIE